MDCLQLNHPAVKLRFLSPQYARRHRDNQLVVIVNNDTKNNTISEKNDARKEGKKGTRSVPAERYEKDRNYQMPHEEMG